MMYVHKDLIYLVINIDDQLLFVFYISYTKFYKFNSINITQIVTNNEQIFLMIAFICQVACPNFNIKYAHTIKKINNIQAN